MRSIRLSFLYVNLAVILLSSCTFNYGTDPVSAALIPDMTMQDVRTDRYENALLSITLSAALIEMYDADRIWVAEDISFTQYSSDGSLAVEAEGFSGLMLVEEAAEVYSLGKGVSVRLVTDKLSVIASDLRWSKKINRLSGSRNGEVEIRKDDGSVIRGTGFFADTLKRSYEFEQTVTGSLVTGTAGPDEVPPDAPLAGESDESVF